MKKVFYSLLMLMLASAAWASDVTILPTGWPTTAQAFSITQGCINIEISNGLDNGQMIRVYKGQQMVITSSCGPMSRIVLYCVGEGDNQYGPGGFMVEPGDYQIEGKIGEWTGSAYRVVFTAYKNQVRITKIVVTLDDGTTTLMPPAISPASDTYYGPIEVTMRCSTPDAEIYYTLDGTIPTTSSTRYTAPFVITEPTTVKAISCLDGEVSDVVTANYDFQELPGSSCFDGLMDLPDGTRVTMTAPVYVLAQYNYNLYVKDQCGGYAYFYGSTGQTYQSGDVIPPGFSMTITTYSGEREFKDLSGFSPASGNVSIEPEMIEGDVLGPELFAHYLYFENVTFRHVSGYTYVMIDANGHEYPVYFGSMGVTPSNNLENGHYNVWAIVGSYGRENTIYQLLPVKLVPCPTELLVITPSQVGPATCGYDVVLKQVGYSSNSIWNLEGESCVALLTFHPYMPAVLCWSYDIYGTVEEYSEFGSSGYRVRITGIHQNCGYDDIADIKRLKTLYKLDDDMLGEYFNLSGHFTTPLTAVYQHNNYLYVRDVYGDFGLVFGYVDGAFVNGDIIQDAVAKPLPYAGIEEIRPAVPSSFVSSGHGPAVQPAEATIASVDKNKMHHLLQFKGVEVSDYDEQTRSWTMSDGNNEIKLYNQFNISVIEELYDLSWYDLNWDAEVGIADVNELISRIVSGETSYEWVGGDNTCDVTGFVYSFHDEMEILPAVIKHHGGYQILVGDLNNDGELTVADLNVLINYILGVNND